MEYSVGNIKLQYEALGARQTGENIVLLDRDFDITSNTEWHDSGYTIQSLFPETIQTSFRDNANKLLIELWRQALLNVAKNFSLEKYHQEAPTFEQHLAAVEFTKLIEVKHFPIDISILEKRISEICNRDLIVRNPFDGQSVFHFRVIRPNQKDHNPLHRDVWLEDYKSCINLYIPIAGSNEKSSLVLVPGSHRWPESIIERTVEGAEINGIKFNVPAVTRILGDANYIRPNPNDNQVLIFSPYLIHGGALNLNDDSTRISIEIRLWKK